MTPLILHNQYFHDLGRSKWFAKTDVDSEKTRSKQTANRSYCCVRWQHTNSLGTIQRTGNASTAKHTASLRVMKSLFANASPIPIYQVPTYQRKETSLMKSNNLKHHLLLAMASAVLLLPAKLNAAEPLKVFILAGQSNTVGHARAHTIATLYASDASRDKELIELVIDANSALIWGFGMKTRKEVWSRRT